MNEAWNDMNHESKLSQAERAVVGSIDKIEHAMESLAGKVDENRQKIEHVVDLGLRQKDELLRLKHTAEDALLPLYRTGVDGGRRLISSVKADPRPYLWGAAILVGALMFWYRRGGAATGRKDSARYDEDWAA